MNILLIIIFVLSLIYHTYTDLKEMLLYDWVNAIILVLGIIYSYLNKNIIDSFYGLFVGAAIMLLVYFVSNGGLGEGDVKLVPSFAVWLGFEKTLLAILLAFIMGAVIGGMLILLKSKKVNSAIPFGPFLCCSALISFFYGDVLLMLYFNFLLRS